MSEVALQIAGRTWRVACAPGEEDRVQRLGRTVAEKLEAMGKTGAADAQAMLFAALLLADEVLEGREGVEAAHAEAAEARREADTASGQTDRLKANIADLEQELGRLQSAHKGAADEMAKVLGIQTELKQAIADHEAENAKLRGELFDARKERDALKAAPPPPPAPAAQPAATVEDAAPALERFAEVLEQCADKLESRAQAT
ncbi:cell division protein ZapA [Tsuneonella amylolytica]|uniref:cell division protein ZapA n=1 Tax=Tsuneonella amylolytica TaxID=2338327 RepID=UPI000EAA98C6|nr:cell division protein ZapA [Tsuneonella amylolytica]